VLYSMDVVCVWVEHVVLRGRLRWATTRHGWDGSRWAYERCGGGKWSAV
jgi:hypothetical protein